MARIKRKPEAIADRVATRPQRIWRSSPAPVLVAGGIAAWPGNSPPLQSAEVYDPVLQRFTPTSGPMTSPRSGHSAIGFWQISANRFGSVVVLAGGTQDASGSGWSAKTDVFEGGTFTAAGDLQEARNGALFGQVLGGPIALIGGMATTGALASTEILTWAQGNNRFSLAAPMSTSRVGHTVTQVRAANRSPALLVVGGFTGDLSSHFAEYSAELYGRDGSSHVSQQPSYTFFYTLGNLNRGRAHHAAALLADGKVLVVGGTQNSLINADETHPTAEVYDPAADTFSLTGQMRYRRIFHTATTLPSGKVLIVGGTHDGIHVRGPAELYDPAAGTFSAGPTLNQPRQRHTATLLGDGNVLIAGGLGADHAVLASAEVYVSSNNAFVTVGSMNSPRYGHTATGIPGTVF